MSKPEKIGVWHSFPVTLSSFFPTSFVLYFYFSYLAKYKEPIYIYCKNFLEE